MKFVVKDISQEDTDFVAQIEAQGMTKNQKDALVEFFQSLSSALEDRKISPDEIFELMYVIRKFFRK